MGMGICGGTPGAGTPFAPSFLGLSYMRGSEYMTIQAPSCSERHTVKGSSVMG